MADKIRCGVIGAGGIGLKHLAGLSQCPDGMAVAIAESNPVRAKLAGEQHQVGRRFADYRELLEQPDVHAVTIALPNYLHAPVAIEALQAGKDVFLEKPMATSYSEARRVVEAARRTGRTLMVGQNFRFHRQTQIAAEHVARGELGEVYHAKVFWLRRAGIPRIGSWFTQKKWAGGGCVYDLGPHLVDLSLSLLGDFEVESVSAQVYRKFGARGLGEFDWGKSEIDPSRPCDVEDFCTALVKLKRGQTVAMEIAWAGHFEKREREMGVDLLGTDGGLTLFPARLCRPTAIGYQTTDLTMPSVPYPENNLHHFVSCLLGKRAPLVTLAESLKVQQVLDAIYESSQSGREVRFAGEEN